MSPAFLAASRRRDFAAKTSFVVPPIHQVWQVFIQLETMSVTLFNPKLHTLRLARSTRQAKESDEFLMRLVIDDMLERLSAVSRQFEYAVALFGRSDYLAEQMKAAPQISQVHRLEEPVATPTLLSLEPNSADLILAPLSLHWSNDLPGTLIQIRQALKPDGLFMAALPGPDTLHELRQALLTAESDLTGGASARIDPFTDIRDAGALLQRAGFALPVVDQDISTVRYNTPLDLIRDLRAFGATNHLVKRSRTPLTRAVIARMMEIYANQFSDDDGRIRASFSFVSLSAWCPHDSQQKPLKPGSAQLRLADALNTEETKL